VGIGDRLWREGRGESRLGTFGGDSVTLVTTDFGVRR